MGIQELHSPIAATVLSPPPVPHRFSVDQYHRKGESRVFSEGDRVELLEGLIVDKHSNGDLHRFTVEQYHRMIETGILTENDKVEVIEGQILEMNPIGSPHWYAGYELTSILSDVAGKDWLVFSQGPVTLAASEPEPDISVIRGSSAAYKARHPGPREIALLVEVADSSLEVDRQVKSPMYAAAGVPEYWIVNLRDRQGEIHRDPRVADGGAAAYHSCEIIPATGKLPLVLDGHRCGEITVAAILP